MFYRTFLRRNSSMMRRHKHLLCLIVFLFGVSGVALSSESFTLSDSGMQGALNIGESQAVMSSIEDPDSDSSEEVVRLEFTIPPGSAQDAVPSTICQLNSTARARAAAGSVIAFAPPAHSSPPLYTMTPHTRILRDSRPPARFRRGPARFALGHMGRDGTCSLSPRDERSSGSTARTPMLAGRLAPSAARVTQKVHPRRDSDMLC